MTRIQELSLISRFSARLDGMTGAELEQPMVRAGRYPADVANRLTDLEYARIDSGALIAQRARRLVMIERRAAA